MNNQDEEDDEIYDANANQSNSSDNTIESDSTESSSGGSFETTSSDGSGEIIMNETNDDDDNGTNTNNNNANDGTGSVVSNAGSVVSNVRRTLKQSLQILLGESLDKTDTLDDEFSALASNRHKDGRLMLFPSSSSLSKADDGGKNMHTPLSDKNMYTPLSSPGGLEENATDKNDNRISSDKKQKRVCFHGDDRTNDSTDHEVGDNSSARELGDSNGGRSKSRAYSREKIDFLKDGYKDMTYSRSIALFLMKRFGWYNPKLKVQENTDNLKEINDFHRDNDNESEPAADFRSEYGYPLERSLVENPSLEQAWAYFEHVALSRHVSYTTTELGQQQKSIFTRIKNRCFKGNTKLEQAEPGENHLHTKLYHPIFTPHDQLGDFGLGIGLYFSNLKGIVILTFLAGLLNIPNFMYFNSEEYSNNQPGLEVQLLGSAICTNQVWVPCPSCEHQNQLESDRLAYNYNAASNTNLTFALRNDCDGATLAQGMVNWATLMFIIVGVLTLNRYLNKIEVEFDEDEQTAQDYSIRIDKPPSDATDPEEWRRYFKEKLGGVITACTISVNNDLLVQYLVERREKMKQLELTVPPGTSLDIITLASLAAKLERERNWFGSFMSRFVPGVPETFSRVVVLTAKIQGLAQQHYPVTSVFVTFETEADQRRALQKLSVGKSQAIKNDKKALADPKYLFRGEHVLYVEEPDEPNTIRWADLNVTFVDKLKQQAYTALATIIGLVLVTFIVWMCSNVRPEYAPYAISIFNAIFPMFAKILTGFESHDSESSKQRSLYFKIALFRWVNTAVVLTLITPFTATINRDGIIEEIRTLFFADIVTTNVIQLLDIGGHIQRHILAPRGATQDAMNLKMQGQQVELAERYTNMTKIFFLALWYCSIYPGALFMCSFALLINYFVDRIGLMRTWKRIPHLGNAISKFSTKYFMTIAICSMAIVSSWFWSGFPFDNLCRDYDYGNEASNAIEDDVVFLFGDSIEPSLIQHNDYIGTWSVERLGHSDYDSEHISSNVTIESNDPIYKYCFQNFWDMRRERRKSNETLGQGVLYFPHISRHQPEGSEWMTDDQELLTDIYGWTIVSIIVLVFLSFIKSCWEEYRNYFRSTYDSSGEDQGINFSDVPSISTYIPQVASSMFSYPLLAVNVDHVDVELLDWTDPNRAHSYYDLTKDAEMLITRHNKPNQQQRSQEDTNKSNSNSISPTGRRNLVFSQIAHWPPPAKPSTSFEGVSQ